MWEVIAMPHPLEEAGVIKAKELIKFSLRIPFFIIILLF